jgi:hypothetical protein
VKLKDLQRAAMEYPCSAGGTYEGHHVEKLPLWLTPTVTGSLKVYCTKCRKYVWIDVSELAEV